MYSLISCPYSPNVFRIRKGSGDVIVDMLCRASGGVCTSDSKPVSNSIRLRVFDFEKEVLRVEECVTDGFGNDKPLVFPFGSGILPNVKIPTRYGHVTIPIVDSQDRRMTTYDVKDGVQLHVRIQAKSAWVSKTHCGISWVLHSIKIL